MLYQKKLRKAQDSYSEMVTIYNDMYASFHDRAERLYSLRQESVEFLECAERFIKGVSNVDASFEKALSDIAVSKTTFQNTSATLDPVDTIKIVAGISRTGAPILKEIAPEVALWATTFGKASTGKAISELKGIAKLNAQKAKLGGGAKSVGGRGIKGGEAFLAMIGPAVEIGFVITTAVAVPAISNFRVAKKLIRGREELQKDLFYLTRAKARLNDLIKCSEDALSACRTRYTMLSNQTNEENAITMEKVSVRTFTDECSALATYLNQTI